MLSKENTETKNSKSYSSLNCFSGKNRKVYLTTILAEIIILLFIIINLIINSIVTNHDNHQTQIIDARSNTITISCYNESIFPVNNYLFDTDHFVKSIKRTVPSLNGFEVDDAYNGRGLEYDKGDYGNTMSLSYWGDVSPDNYGGGISYLNEDYRTYVYMEKNNSVDRLRIQIDKCYGDDVWNTSIFEVEETDYSMNVGYRRLPDYYSNSLYNTNTNYNYGNFEIFLGKNNSRITYTPRNYDNSDWGNTILQTNDNEKDFYTGLISFLKYASCEVPELLKCYDRACEQFSIDGKKYIDESKIKYFFNYADIVAKDSIDKLQL